MKTHPYATIRFKQEVVFHTPFHTTAWESKAGVDMALALNGEGVPNIAGTGIAGVLRSFTDPHLGKDSQLFWGTRDEKLSRRSRSNTTKSLAYVADAPLKDAPTGTRPSVRISHFSRAASPNGLYSFQTIPKGTQFNLAIEVVCPTEAEYATAMKVLEHIDWLIREKHVRLGKSGTRGLGRIGYAGGQSTTHIQVDKHSEADWADELFHRLTGQPVGKAVLLHSAPISLLREDFKLPFTTKGPILVQAGVVGPKTSSIPMQDNVKVNGNWQFFAVIPGKSIAGALLHRCEWIIRTAFDLKTTPFEEIPLLAELFGCAKSKKGNGRKSALMADDCFATDPFDDEHFTYKKAIAKRRVSNAIDRWTGGVVENKLFSATIIDVNWEPLQITLDLSRIDARRHEAVYALLRLAFTELNEGLWGFGARQNTGFGRVAIDSLPQEWKLAKLRDHQDAILGLSEQLDTKPMPEGPR